MSLFERLKQQVRALFQEGGELTSKTPETPETLVFGRSGGRPCRGLVAAQCVRPGRGYYLFRCDLRRGHAGFHQSHLSCESLGDHV